MRPVLPLFLIARWLLLIVIVIGVYFIKGFLVPSLTALVIGIASWPIFHRIRILFYDRTILSASILLILVILLLVIPITIALSYAIQEAGNFIAWAIAVNKNGIEAPSWILSMPLFGDRFSEFWRLYLGEPHALGRLVQLVSGEHLGNIYRMILSATGNVFHLLLTLLFMLITLFFVYKDGESMLKQLDILGESIIPNKWMRLSRVVPAMISATVTGMVLIAMGEGVVLGFAYWIADVPSPVLLGVLTCFMALVPGGAPVVFTLVSLYLIGSDKTMSGVCLFFWGIIELFIVDKTIRPKLIGGPVKLPFLPTFFGLIGGIQTMGIIGLFIGPVFIALMVAIWREWVHSTNIHTYK
ncbi:conserved membrane protein [Candidatus Kinetoplastibacterium blastocrithidii TCC012E]|uniref:Conserved membrane protein n=1 Tax=Candidatus Kinetoplastidibacterium blastocrithidiae TCC012E TaxID=1208922 RepID=M1M2V9_9PROT|nr:AI-2E family transporter [Candidatus Kinetoplastibacterium blastocrithidii]AFZ83433.1 membrane protein [Candidatus Kinetoplastibacterium blastocrithidii (ex Strigomonas culicis)]AGF49529.1 conserved membrane protein [Candidatus Kinetoplastibacterium blastocrithidii TCC012E]